MDGIDFPSTGKCTGIVRFCSFFNKAKRCNHGNGHQGFKPVVACFCAWEWRSSGPVYTRQGPSLSLDLDFNRGNLVTSEQQGRHPSVPGVRKPHMIGRPLVMWGVLLWRCRRHMSRGDCSDSETNRFTS